MNILIIGNINSSHILNIAYLLRENGHQVTIFTVHRPAKVYFNNINIILSPPIFLFGYLLGIFFLRSAVKKITPEIVNVHYASGYGFLSALSFLKIPTVLSVWGSDIYLFPLKSIIHKYLLIFNLSRANLIASTSICMAKRTMLYTNNQNIAITPFGVDINEFSPLVTNYNNSSILRIGTVKTLHSIYGIDILLRSFALLLGEYKGSLEIRLAIAGDGPDRKILESLSKDLGISQYVTFHGAIDHSSVPRFINSLDIFVALSRQESFGVAVLEASSCSKPVIVSNAEGLVEIVMDNVTGFIVPINDFVSAADLLMQLIASPYLRNKMGINGRAHVLKNYSKDVTLTSLIDAYNKAICIFNGKNKISSHN